MSKLNYIQGDLFTTTNSVIAHGCNICGAFGAGIAGQIAQKFPEVKSAYFLKHNNVGHRLGDIQIVKIENPKTSVLYIVNMMTQNSYGRNGKHVSYNACHLAFGKLFEFCHKNNLSLSIPKIGTGLGGGSWEKIEEQLVNTIQRYNITVDVYTKQ